MQSQMYVPPLSKVNKIIISVYVGTFILGTILMQTAGIKLVNIFGLSVVGLETGYIFQLVTYPFVDSGLINVVFNSMMIWFIGSELEAKWGTRFYLKYLAIATYMCGLCYVLIGLSGGKFVNFLPLFGLAGTNLALLLAYGIIFSERTMLLMFIFPVKAKYFCMILGAMELYLALTASAFNSAWAHLISMISGYAFLKYQSMRVKGLGIGQILQNHKDHRAKQKRGKLHIVKDDDDEANSKDPKYWQ
jgi:membrane associated rhomboid family serine protease